MKILSILSILSFSLAVNAHTYRVYFTDKGENMEMLQNPYSFLSPKAVSRKALHHTTIDLSDLPVSRNYLQALASRGLKVEMKSRWFNYALVEGDNVEHKVADLPFVKSVEKAQSYKVKFATVDAAVTTQALVYGEAANQIKMVNGDYLHNAGYLGEGMTIAMLDGGFTGATTLSGLDSLFMRGRILGTYNFVDHDTNVFSVGSHGTKVLSIMGGYIQNNFVGTAIHAKYWLLKSENEASETPVEMDNWLAAAEFADSVGADIISSSLGYNLFDGGQGDISYSDLDGNTTLVTRAADMAAQKGLLVIVSAGNEGISNWQHITAPADGDSVLAIGGVDGSGRYVNFSSLGPTADGRIKPDVVAQAAGTAFAGLDSAAHGNGTSFSCPLIAGLAACLWQEFPSRTNMQIFDAIRSSASQPYTPDNFLGYGIANFRDASWRIGLNETELTTQKVEVYPNPVKDEFSLRLSGFESPSDIFINIYDMQGRLMEQTNFTGAMADELKIKAPSAPGSYLINIMIGDKVYLRQIVK